MVIMKQDVSALMDGELFDDEAEALLADFKGNDAAHADWHAYHLIGDALRQPDHVNTNVAAQLRKRLAEEPTILAPRARSKQNARWFALSAAASVMALTVVGFLSAQVRPDQAAVQPLAAQQSAVQDPEAIRPASYKADRNVNSYLMAHQEFSPSQDMQGSAAYIRAVAEK
jgi:sigma-E factor negative regulatory protein RseA